MRRAALALVVLAPGLAAAEPSPPRGSVAVPLLALSSQAIAVEGEAPIARRLSAAVIVGARDPADGDYGGYTLALGGELRGWWRASQRGPYLGLRAEGQVTHLARRDGGSLGTGIGLTQALVLGYRWVVRDRVAITVDAGVAIDEDLGHGRIPARVRGTPLAGLALGWQL